MRGLIALLLAAAASLADPGSWMLPPDSAPAASVATAEVDIWTVERSVVVGSDVDIIPSQPSSVEVNFAISLPPGSPCNFVRGAAIFRCTDDDLTLEVDADQLIRGSVLVAGSEEEIRKLIQTLCREYLTAEDEECWP